MKVRNFAVLVSKHEGLKKQVNIAQIMEILCVINRLSGGLLYKLIRQDFAK